MSTRAIHIKDYLSSLYAAEDDVLLTIKKNAKLAGLPEIEVPNTVGKLLYCLTKIQRPRRALEVGTLAGYSTVWIGRALPEGGKLISLELYSLHVDVARKNLALAGLENKVEIREGLAEQLMDEMISQGEQPFDLIFIDADKENYPLYLEKALKLSHSGTLILSDNLIPKGDEIGSPHNLESEGIYQFNQKIASHPQLESILATTIVGSKGRIDALGISIVR